MKHLRKAFSNHRLIRTNPEDPQDTLSSQTIDDSPYTAQGPSTSQPQTWRRRKPAFTHEITETVPGFITLWDETGRKKSKKI